jgi:hypothetical protein
MVGLLILVGFIVLVLSFLPGKGYRCGECRYWTPDRQDAAGHQYLGTLHKML